MPRSVRDALSPRRAWRAWPFWLKACIVGAFIFLAAAFGTWWSGESGTFPAWLEATATFAALGAAMFAVRYAANAWVIETEREDRFIAERRSAQASLVAAWPGSFSFNDSDVDPYSKEFVGKGLSDVQVSLRNASDVPVTRVWIDATLVVVRPHGEILRLQFATREVVRLLEPTAVPALHWVPADSPVDPARYVPAGFEPEYWCELAVSFRDAGGRDWERLPDGQLILVQDAEAHDL